MARLAISAPELSDCFLISSILERVFGLLGTPVSADAPLFTYGLDMDYIGIRGVGIEIFFYC